MRLRALLLVEGALVSRCLDESIHRLRHTRAKPVETVEHGFRAEGPQGRFAAVDECPVEVGREAAREGGYLLINANHRRFDDQELGRFEERVRVTQSAQAGIASIFVERGLASKHHRRNAQEMRFSRAERAENEAAEVFVARERRRNVP